MGKTSFLKVAVELFNDKSTGVLKISKDQVEKSIYFKNGQIIYVDSSLRAENLGRILVDQKKISEEQFERVVKKVDETGKRQGEVLVELGYLSAFDVFEALKDQLSKKVLNCFALDDFKWEFQEGSKHLEKITEIPINTLRTLIDGVQTSYTFEVLKEEATFSKEMAPYVIPESRNKIDNLGLKPDEIKLLKLFDGKQTLFNIVKNSGIDPQFVMATTHILNVLGILDYKTLIIKKHVPERPKIVIKPPTEEKPKALDKSLKTESPKQKDLKDKSKKDGAKKPDQSNTNEEKLPIKEEPPKPLTLQTEDKNNPIYPLYLKIDTQGYLELFGLSVKFKKDDLKRNYDELLRKYHLDNIDQKYSGQPKEMAERVLNKVLTAFAVLKDEKKKEAYLKMRATTGSRPQEEDNLLKAEIEMSKAMLFKKRNAFDKAFECLKKAIELNDKEIEYLVSIAEIIMARSDALKSPVSREAEEYLKKALGIDGHSAAACLSLGIYYKMAGDRQKAINCFNKTLQINPSNQRAQAELRLFNIRKEKKPLFSFSMFSKKPEDKEAKKPEDESDDTDV
jgi:tetratricopeptide (TPR) repeat protein